MLAKRKMPTAWWSLLPTSVSTALPRSTSSPPKGATVGPTEAPYSLDFSASLICDVGELCNCDPVLGALLGDNLLDSISHFKTLLGWSVASGEINADVDIDALALPLQCLFVGLSVMGKVVTDQADLWSVAQTTLRDLNMLAED